MAHPARQAIETWGIRLVERGVRPLPRRVVLRLAAVLGRAAYHLLPGWRRIGRENLRIVARRHAVPAGAERILQRSCWHFALTSLDMFWLERLGPANFLEHVVIDVAEARALAERQAAGVPIILICLHHGNWELLSTVYSLLGVRMNVVMQPLKNPYLDALVRRRRGTEGQVLLDQRGSAGALLRGLGAGRCPALVIDQNIKPIHGGVWVEFFGLPVPMSRAVGTLAARAEAEVYGLYGFAEADGRYRIGIGWRHTPPPRGPRERVADEVLAGAVAYMERTIARWPEPWLWMYKRWKYRYPGRESEYPAYSKAITWQHLPRHRLIAGGGDRGNWTDLTDRTDRTDR